MRQYLSLLQDILDNGRTRGDRTGTGTRGLFGRQLRFDLREGFPLLTTKKMFFRGIVAELLWFISGSTDEHVLRDQGVHIWREWATPEQCARFGRKPGDLGPIYGHQWRNFGATKNEDGTYQRDGFDQLAWLVNEIKTNPNSRRLILTGWNPKEATEVALPACHTVSQFYVQDGELSLQLYQRSADVFLGVPFNLATYALLAHLMADATGLRVGEFVYTFGDVHLYNDHFDQARLQLTREPLPLPRLSIGFDAPKDIFAIKASDINLVGYESHPAIKAAVSI